MFFLDIHGIIERRREPVFSIWCVSPFLRRALYFFRPPLYSATHCWVNLPVWISFRIFFISRLVAAFTTRGPRVMSPYLAVSEMEKRMPAMPDSYIRSQMSFSSWRHSK